MADVIAVASGKGGVGKSTFSWLLGGAFASMGRKTLLIDLDAGLNALDILFGVRENTVFGWNDVSEGRCSLDDAVMNCGENIDLLASPSAVTSFDSLSDITNSLREKYDRIILDAPAGLESGFVGAVKNCDKTIMVATPDAVSVQGAAKAARKAVEYGVKITDQRIVINRFLKKEAMKSRLLNIDGVIDSSGVRLLGIIPEDKSIICMSVTGKIPKKKSEVYSAAKRIAMRVEGKNVPLDFKHMK